MVLGAWGLKLPFLHPLFRLWKAYLQTCCLYVLGKGTKKKRAGSRKKWAEVKEAMEDEELELETYEGGLDPVVGWLEWKESTSRNV